MSVTTRRVSLVGALLLLVGGAFLMRYLQQQKAPPPRKPKTENPIRSVQVRTVDYGTVNTSVEVQGQLQAYDKIDLFAEVGGLLKSTGKSFKEGTYFSKGDVLLQIENTEPRLALLAQRAQLENAIAQMMPDLQFDYPESVDHWQRYLNEFDVERSTPKLPEAATKREKYLVAARNLQNLYYNIKSSEERLSKYTVYAPFSGEITNAVVRPGALVRAGQKVGELMNTSRYELAATVPLSDIVYLSSGNKVTLSSPDVGTSWTGSVSRISDQIDPTTQNVKVFISVSGKGLYEGMFLKGQVRSGTVKDALAVPRKYLTGDNELYMLTKDSTLQTVPVEVVKISGMDAVVRGIAGGTTILDQNPIGAYVGEKVKPITVTADARQ